MPQLILKIGQLNVSGGFGQKQATQWFQGARDGPPRLPRTLCGPQSSLESRFIAWVCAKDRVTGRGNPDKKDEKADVAEVW